MEQYLRDSSLVQSVERRTVNPYVTGSSPVRGAKFKKPAFEQAFCFSAPVLMPEGEWPPSGDCGFSVNSLPSDLSPAAPHKK